MATKRKIRISKRDFLSIFRLCIVAIIPFTIIFILLFNYIYNIQLENSINMVLKEEAQRSDIIDYTYNDIYNKLIEDLFVIKDSNEIQGYINNPNYFNKYEAQQMMLRMALNKPSFDQIRYLDVDGNEIIRINNTDSGPRIVSDSLLQNKSEMTYFKESQGLVNDQIFISKMELNLENSKVEIPYKPIVRVITPLFDSSRNKKGVLIINFMGQDLLNIINRNFSQSEYSFINFSLINNEGYYLYNEDSRKTFSFSFPSRDQYNLINEMPTFWNKIIANDLTPYNDGTEIYTFKKLSHNVANDINAVQRDFWYVITSFELSSLPIAIDRLIFNLTPVELLILIILDCLIILLIIFIYFRRKVKEELELTRTIAENANDAIIITDSETRIIFANKSFEHISGYTIEEVLGHKTNTFKSELQSAEFYKSMWYDLVNKKFWEGELWDKKKSGLLYPKHVKIFAIEKKYSNKTDKFIGIYQDLTQIKERDKNIDKLKNYNIATDLPNEVLLNKLIDSKISSDKFIGLLCLKITNYNSIFFNRSEKQTYYVLKNLIDKIKKLVTENDIIAQISKDTFVIGLLSYNDREEIRAFLDSLFLNFKTPENKRGNTHYLDLKGGVSLYPEDGKDVQELLRNAIIALDAAQKDQSTKYIFSTLKMQETLKKNLRMSLLLRNAISRNEFNLNYQPQVDIKSSKIIGAEALLRWNNEELGNVSPFFFIPIAEKNGFIIDIGYWIIERVFKDFEKIKDNVSKDFKLSINISPIQFKDDILCDKFIYLSNKYNIDLSYFELEITESVFVDNINQVNKKLNRFKELGFSIALDDFGTGFSSLSVLKDMVIDKIKVDRSFIKDYPQSDNGGIAKTIISLANALHLKVITEGAETKEQVDYLYSVGCDSIQGYYYSKPIEIEDLLDYIKNHN